MWQKCPICNGTGNHYQPYINETSSKCNTCEGKGIIDTITGLPPKGIQKFEAPKYKQEIDSTQIDEFKIIRTEPRPLFVQRNSNWYNIVEAYYNK